MNETSNVLEEMLYSSNLQHSNERKRYDRGMFISINNHKQGNDDLCASLKKQYQSLWYAMTGDNVSRNEIKVTDKLPTQKTILHLMAKNKIVLAAALHSYDCYNNRTGRGSRFNYGAYHHLHFYVYGLHHLMQQHDGGVDAAVEHIKRCLFRHNKFSVPDNPKNIDIREVGVGKYQYNDVVSPTTLIDYLSLPKTNPAKDCVINYMAGTCDGGELNPILYVYQTGVN